MLKRIDASDAPKASIRSFVCSMTMPCCGCPTLPKTSASSPSPRGLRRSRSARIEPGEPGRMPAFLETRVYQGSSGRVYPLPFIEIGLAPAAPAEHWQAVHLENDYLRLMILPELGGRLHVALDKTNGYDFVYRNNVHQARPRRAGRTVDLGRHRVQLAAAPSPGARSCRSTATIEHEADGAVTVWCSDHDPFERMKGMHGFRLRPGASLIELECGSSTAPPLPQTFLWWANVAAACTTTTSRSSRPTCMWSPITRNARSPAFPAADRPYYGDRLAARADARSPSPARRRRPHRLVPEHPRADVVHVRRLRRRLLRRIRSRAPASGSCTSPTITSRRERSSGPGAMRRSAKPGTAT